jgi:hypothetical protein
MAGLKMIDGVEVINICPNNSEGPIIEIESLNIQLPESTNVLFQSLPIVNQRWQRFELPRELEQIKSMDDWYESPREFQQKWSPTSRRSSVEGKKVCGL